MGDTLSVDIPGLIRGGSNVAEQASLLAAAHGRSVSSVNEAQSGWVGSSAQALSALTGHWDSVTTRHTTAIEHHATQMDTTAKMFSYMEERNAAALKAVGEQCDPVDM